MINVVLTILTIASIFGLIAYQFVKHAWKFTIKTMSGVCSKCDVNMYFFEADSKYKCPVCGREVEVELTINNKNDKEK